MVTNVVSVEGAVGRRQERDRLGARARRVWVTLVGLTASLAAGSVWLVAPDFLLFWVLALVPALLVVYQGLHLALFRNSRFFSETQHPTMPADTTGGLATELNKVMVAAWEQERNYYSSPALVIRYLLPAALLFTMSLAIAAWWTGRLPLLGMPDDFRAAASYGAAGAYLYVLFYLGQRTFSFDISSGAALWSAVTLAIGPLFAGMIGKIFELKLEAGSQWKAALPLFAAGFSARFMYGFVQESLRRVLGKPETSTTPPMPLTLVRGIDRHIAERLAEEGVHDVAGLATANPQRLRRNTAFDRRQLMSWMDEALLIYFLPKIWRELQENEGISGAIDLAWYVDQVPAVRVDVPGCETAASLRPLPPAIGQLAERVSTNADSLWATMQRVHDDAQVRLVWVLYQLDEKQGLPEA